MTTSQLKLLFAALSVVGLVLTMGTAGIIALSPGERTISIYNIHNKETLTIVYKRDGQYIPAAMTKINWIMRDWRRDEPTKMDPKLVDLIWEIHTELGSKKPVHLISGFRSRKTNNMLRRKQGGQAKNSRHILGKAADIHFPDIPAKRLRYSALVRERGGVGYYPTSALPFVHVDTGRVRHWPRMRRYELALLFPDGKTKHRPRGGGAIRARDVKAARVKYASLAKSIDAFHRFRAQPRSQRPTLLASNDRPTNSRAESGTSVLSFEVPRPKLASLGTPIDTISGWITKNIGQQRAPANPGYQLASASPVPIDQERLVPVPRPAGPSSKLPASNLERGPESANRNELLGGQTIDGAFFSLTGWASAPSYDAEHPGELSYRPFPIGPLLSETPDIDHPRLAKLLHPDLAGARALIGVQDYDLPMRFKPGVQVAEMLWADLFTSGGLNGLTTRASVSGSPGRTVQTAVRN